MLNGPPCNGRAVRFSSGCDSGVGTHPRRRPAAGRSLDVEARDVSAFQGESVGELDGTSGEPAFELDGCEIDTVRTFDPKKLGGVRIRGPRLFAAKCRRHNA